MITSSCLYLTRCTFRVCVFRPTTSISVADARSPTTCRVLHASSFWTTCSQVSLSSRVSGSASSRSAQPPSAAVSQRFYCSRPAGRANIHSRRFSAYQPQTPRRSADIWSVWRRWVDWNLQYFVICTQKNVANTPGLHFDTTGELTPPGSPCTGGVGCSWSDSARAWQQKQSPILLPGCALISARLGNEGSFFSPPHSTFMIFSVKVLAEVRYRWCFSMFVRWAGGDLGRAQTFWHTAWKHFLKGPK